MSDRDCATGDRAFATGNELDIWVNFITLEQ